ncbi:hypothetical protein V0288_11270 [Pannus brasiliensis CCIBt3594]|uniref:Uncharacterized protein n=1 Tax=Pannus brasiliensis CCIBt3594 TaxID=1427578 RepID=A0AAW9QIS5_9CHRO
MVNNRYIMGQGKVYLDSIDPATGLPMGKARFVGNVPDGGLMFNIAVTKYEHKESFTGQGLIDASIERDPVTTGMLRLESFDRANLILAFYGEGATVAGGTVSAESHTAYKGFAFQLAKMNLESFTSLTNNASPPVPYVKGTDYTIDLKSGMVEILADGAIADESEVRANYVALGTERVTGFAKTNEEFWLIFNGKNKLDTDKPVKLQIFKCRFQPAKALDLINSNNTQANLEMDFSAIYEERIAEMAAYKGGLFSIEQTQAA